MTAIHGSVAPGFEPVRDAFARNFAEHGDVGAACCVLRDGEPVVDLWGGLADAERGTPWSEDTLVLVFSTTKGVTAACVHLLVERGKLALDAPLADVWPEFAANGKQAITLRQVLSHRAGLPLVEGDFTLETALDGESVPRALAAQEPLWEPGTRHGYHVRTYGWILGELVRRVTGESLGRFLARELTGPRRLDFFLGLPEREERRVATLIPPEPPSDPEQIALREKLLGPDTVLGRALDGPSGLFGYGPVWNTRPLRAAELPSSNGVASARGVAGVYAALASADDSERLLSRATLAAATRVESDGADAVIHVPMRFGLGFLLPPLLGPGCPEGAFGHAGAGGSLGFADPGNRLAFGYAMNRMQLGLTGDPRAAGLVQATYACLRSHR